MRTRSGACRACRSAGASQMACPQCGGSGLSYELYDSLRRAGLVAAPARRNRSKRWAAFGFIAFTGGLLALLGHSGDEPALIVMGAMMAGAGAVFAAGADAVALFVSFANSRAGRFLVGVTLGVILLLVLLTGSDLKLPR